MKGKKSYAAGGMAKPGSGDRKLMTVAGNPDVFKEAASKGTSRKKGGKVKRNTGGVVPALMTGGAVRPRLDRPGRKTGGRVGADKAPLSTAHSGAAPGGPTPNPKDTYGGLPPD